MQVDPSLPVRPGPRSRALARELRRYECRNVTFCSPEFPVFWQRAEGAAVWDVDGYRYLDLTSGFGVASLGYGPLSVREAAVDQLGSLYHAMGDVHPAEVKVQLCRALSQATFERWGAGIGKSILTTSGGEAVEAALKSALIATGRPRIVAFGGAYHGLGYGALTVGGLEEFRAPFESQLADLTHWLPFPAAASARDEELCSREQCASALEQLLGRGDIGAIIVEPIQGRAGVIIPPDWFLPLLRQMATNFGALLIVDEIYTGFYRTGAWMACETAGVVPDIICLGKALTSGFPLAACVGSAAVMDCWPESNGEALHTSTFLGNPLGCRMAVAAIAALKAEPWGERVNELGRVLEEGLRSLDLGPVRGRGLLWGVELRDEALAGRMITQGLQRGLILLSGGPRHNVLKFSPPFVVTVEELQGAVRIVKEIVESSP